MIKLINKKGGLIKGSKKNYFVLLLKRIARIFIIQKLLIFTLHCTNIPPILLFMIHENIAFLEGQFDAVILGVAHNEVNSLDIRCFLRINNGVVYDVKDDILCRKYIDGCL